MENEIEAKYVIIPNENLDAFIQKAYALSRPQGLGFLHAREGTLTQDEVDNLKTRSFGISMDYVNGRSVKLTIFKDKETGEYTVEDYGHWYDHSDEAWRELLSVVLEPEKEHVR